MSCFKTNRSGSDREVQVHFCCRLKFLQLRDYRDRLQGEGGVALDSNTVYYRGSVVLVMSMISLSRKEDKEKTIRSTRHMTI